MPAASKPGLAFRIFALRTVTFAIGSLGLVWGISNLASGAAADDFRDVEARLLRFETFNRSAAIRMLEGAAVENVGACDNHSQRVLLLLEIPLADAALRSGAFHEYDQHIQSLEARVRRILNCSPRESFVWLAAFGLEIEHGVLNEHSFDLLAMSYETSPNEAWVAVRRIVVAIPVVFAAPEAVRQKILTEFEHLVSDRFIEIPARAYLNAPAAVRTLLQSRIDQLDPLSQSAFSDALHKLRS